MHEYVVTIYKNSCHLVFRPTLTINTLLSISFNTLYILCNALKVQNIFSFNNVFFFLTMMLQAKVGESGEFKCKTCNKQFLSFQALGGHRASHKKLKPMLSNLSCSMVAPKLHRCSICGLVFGIGQALGGHMRKHRVSSNDSLPPTIRDQDLPESNKKIRLLLDLNLTPHENDLNLNLRTPVLHLFLWSKHFGCNFFGLNMFLSLKFSEIWNWFLFKIFDQFNYLSLKMYRFDLLN